MYNTKESRTIIYILFITLLFGLMGCGQRKKTKLHQALLSENLGKAEEIIKNGKFINSKFKNGLTPIHLATRKGYKKLVEKLISQGADVNVQTDEGFSPLHGSVIYPEIVEKLIAAGAKVNIETNDGGTPLHSAVMLGVVKQSEETVTEFPKDKEEILQAGVRSAELLVKNGADLKAKTNKGKTALDFAREYGYTQMKDLLEKYI